MTPPQPDTPASELNGAIDAAVAAIRRADGLLITAGAGMGVDSGLPDFRGAEGFWQAYPAFGKLGLRFQQIASPRWFDDDPALAWGFYGHRLDLYNGTTPHAGFKRLLEFASAKPAGYFVFTSNVDGQFQKAGFNPDRIVECHGSIHHAQCVLPCHEYIWPLTDGVRVDPDTVRAAGPFPHCLRCRGLARPNVLMFGDSNWVPDRADEQYTVYRFWLSRLRDARLAILEFGAGSAIPTVRRQSEQIAYTHNAPLVRINPREPHAPLGHISLPVGSLQAVQAIAERL